MPPMSGAPPPVPGFGDVVLKAPLTRPSSKPATVVAPVPGTLSTRNSSVPPLSETGAPPSVVWVALMFEATRRPPAPAPTELEVPNPGPGPPGLVKVTSPGAAMNDTALPPSLSVVMFNGPLEVPMVTVPGPVAVTPVVSALPDAVKLLPGFILRFVNVADGAVTSRLDFPLTLNSLFK